MSWRRKEQNPLQHSCLGNPMDEEAWWATVHGVTERTQLSTHTQTHIHTHTHKYIRKSEVKVLVAQLCLPLCDPMDCSPPGSSVHGISQARMLKWVAIHFSRGSSCTRDWTWVSCNAGGFFTELPGKPVYTHTYRHSSGSIGISSHHHPWGYQTLRCSYPFTYTVWHLHIIYTSSYIL